MGCALPSSNTSPSSEYYPEKQQLKEKATSKIPDSDIFRDIMIGKKNEVNQKIRENRLLSQQLNSKGMDLLQQAVRFDNFEVVETLLDLGIDVNHVDELGHTALSYAVMQLVDGDRRMVSDLFVQMLVEHGAIIGTSSCELYRMLRNYNFKVPDNI